MKSLLIDVGNTSCKYAVSRDGHLLSCRRNTGEDIAQSVAALLNGDRPDIIAISSVRGGEALYREALSSLCGRLIILNSETPLPIKLDYGTPQTLGADRIAAAVAANAIFRNEDVLIFDFGTAITVDRLTADGVFAGGNISIGLKSRLQALHQLTARLPEVEPSECPPARLGKSTGEALVCGAVSGIIFEVSGYIESYPEHKIVFSGGDSIFFAKRMKNPIFADYNLVLKGLALIAEYNAQI